MLLLWVIATLLGLAFLQTLLTLQMKAYIGLTLTLSGIADDRPW